ncbi:hypothetical protein GZ77_03485 [Endozoicomonas montiporae]|uniref:Uncharacterized protein n=2 Tax=Endozoicomonas montiporae TaxID=1027273 RepID=A0A081NB35_9GAMM|nr:hypothetical protein [Endozoicomonas montiporae]AMO56635.1 hypothetical protein EZMO1_2556 [Endozoicomonas montiporae CL-33]KEQ15658.1 hypothetical protein GZ77_03485 [Endozoicomonas montiporae]
MVNVVEDVKKHGLLYGLLTLVLTVSGVDLGKTDSISNQITSMDKRLTVAEYRINELEEERE